jgi:hypothetical protein
MLPGFESLRDDARRIWHEESAPVREEPRTKIVLDTGVVQVHSDEPTALLHRHVDFPFHVGGLGVRVLADQENVSVAELNLGATTTLDVGLVSRIDGVVELEVGEVEIDVLMCFPCAHEAVMYVGAAKSDERTRKEHRQAAS